ncbi:DsbA family protein [Streptomyces sp. NPDC048361]|uniref:2-hydroxychromene-2-carboxylate isomerase n=1 Tax=Streptomyces sp. NPDC048361 TaxID=3154720 RepID=UPI003421995F
MSPAAKPKTPRFYFNLRSPYSWLAHREVLSNHKELVDQLEWLPFFEPDEESTRELAERGGAFPYSEMSREKNRYVLQDVGRLTKARGITVTWPVDRAPVWEVPHLGYLVAQEHGLAHEYITAVYEARFGAGLDICDRRTIADIGGRLGIDRDLIADASDDADLRAEGVRILMDVCKDGVFGVPFFVHGYTRFWGLDRLDDFVSHLAAKKAPALALVEPSGAVGLGRSVEDAHAGGCG